MLFRDRADAGRYLAEALGAYAGRPDVQVLALPRGGVPVAFEVARALGASLDVFLVRKLGVPGHRELAMGAVASGGVRVLNDDVVRGLQIPARVVDAVAERELEELARRQRAYRDDRPPPMVRGRAAILVDAPRPPGRPHRQRRTQEAHRRPVPPRWAGAKNLVRLDAAPRKAWWRFW